MEHEGWPTPQASSREPLPRVDDLPVADQGYEQESVKAAFDSFYRHAAQLDAALRTLEAVDSFHRQAASLRSDIRALRSAGWTQQSWTQPPAYGYGTRAPREGVPPAVWRIGGEVAFLVAVAVVLGVAKLPWLAILLAMAGAFTIVCVIEWLAAREPTSFARTAAPVAAVHPVVEAQRAEDTDEHDSLGWTAFEEAQEPSDAMTIIGSLPREEEPESAPDDVEAASPADEPGADPEPDPEDEPELPPAADANQGEGSRRWWRRKRESDGPALVEPDAEHPRHVRVLPSPDVEEESDPWEQGFDAGEEPGVLQEEAPGHHGPR